MRTKTFALCGALLCLAAAATPADAKRADWDRPTTFDDKVTELCKAHKVPERLVHRVIMRESRYNPRAVSKGNYGLMQIRLGTAQTMGYKGSAMGLTDAITNLTYAVPYLANAYAVAGRDEDRAVQLYAAGFYYHAKRQGLLAKLQTGKGRGEPDTDVVAYAPAAPINPIAALFGALASPAQAAVDAAQAESAAARAQFAANGEAVADESNAVDVPLPPRRPSLYSTPRFLKLAMKQDPIDSELRGSETE